MKRSLNIIIDSGETRCSPRAGKFCPQMLTLRMGSIFHCGLFDKELRDEGGVLSGPGWLQRLPECIGAEKKANP